MCERDINQLPCTPLGTWATTWACALMGNQPADLSVCRPGLNAPSHTSQGGDSFFTVVSATVLAFLKMTHCLKT